LEDVDAATLNETSKKIRIRMTSMAITVEKEITQSKVESLQHAIYEIQES
jgi:hypothetical protein